MLLRRADHLQAANPAFQSELGEWTGTVDGREDGVPRWAGAPRPIGGTKLEPGLRPFGHAARPTFLAVFAYFMGTVLYVKTMIRERGSIGYRRASVGYHLMVFVLATWWHPLLGVFFGLALARAWLLPGRALRPVHVGIVEIALSAALLVILALTA